MPYTQFSWSSQTARIPTDKRSRGQHQEARGGKGVEGAQTRRNANRAKTNNTITTTKITTTYTEDLPLVSCAAPQANTKKTKNSTFSATYRFYLLLVLLLLLMLLPSQQPVPDSFVAATAVPPPPANPRDFRHFPTKKRSISSLCCIHSLLDHLQDHPCTHQLVLFSRRIEEQRINPDHRVKQRHARNARASIDRRRSTRSS